MTFCFFKKDHQNSTGIVWALKAPAVLFTFLCTTSFGQYSGGGNDGASVALAVQQSFSFNIYGGNGDDGFHYMGVNQQPFSLNLYAGGIDDGFHSIAAIQQSLALNFYTGGGDDGFHSLTMFQQPLSFNIYGGGGDDGFHSISVIQQPLSFNIYAGGGDDGFHSTSANQQPLSLNIYTGGGDDGFHSIAATQQPLSLNIYTGGGDDGFTLASGNNQPISGNIYIGGGNDGFTVAEINLIALPVTLTSFTGQWQQEDVLLKWITSTEINNDHFEIQRSFTGQNFVTIGSIPGAGNSTVENRYTYFDINAKALSSKSLFYRLKQVDFNGHANYSGVVMLRKEEIAFQLSVYPNPTRGLLNIYINDGLVTPGHWKYRLYSIQGALLKEGAINDSKHQVDMKHLAAGSYLIQVENDAKLLQTFKIILVK